MTAASALPPLQPLSRLQPATFETTAVLRKAVTAGRKLAELKGLAASMPNQAILAQAPAKIAPAAAAATTTAKAPADAASKPVQPKKDHKRHAHKAGTAAAPAASASK